MDETFGEVVVAAVPVPLLLPFLGAIAGCHCWAPLGRNFGEVVVAAVPGCHCRAPLVDQTFGEVAAVPGCQGAILLGANVRCHGRPGAMDRCHIWVPCGGVSLLNTIDGCHLEGIAGCHVMW